MKGQKDDGKKENTNRDNESVNRAQELCSPERPHCVTVCRNTNTH